MKASKIKSIILNEGVEQASLIIEEEIFEARNIKTAFLTFLVCVSLLAGMCLMYFIEK